MTVITMDGNPPVEIKRVKISSKRQITIPQKYYTMLGFDSSAECLVRGNELVIRPVQENSGGEFAEQILEELIKQGYSGEELLRRFKETRKEVRPAVERMLAEAQLVAEGAAEYATCEDVFGEEESNDRG